jgi:hypothetical protein
MRNKGVLLVALALTLTGAAHSAWAQSGPTRRVEVLGSGAVQQLWDDESSIGAGVAGGGGASVALTRTLSFRGRIVRSRNERDFGNGVVFEASATRYTADLIWQPTSSVHAPYFGVGAGGFSYTRTSHYPAGPAGETFSRSDTDTILGGLAGFTALSREHFRVRPEASLWWSRPGNFIAVEVGVVAAWRF